MQNEPTPLMKLGRLYLRASTEEQNASRAKAALETFAVDHGITIVGTYTENQSGAGLARPELFRLLHDSRPGDVLLLENVDRLSRLNERDWLKLRTEIERKEVRVVAMDLPTSWNLIQHGDAFTGRMLSAVNNLMMDILAAVARKDYEDRRRRQAEGIASAKVRGSYRGRPEDAKRNNGIAVMLSKGLSWSQIQSACGCSRATISKIAKRVPASKGDAVAL